MNLERGRPASSLDAAAGVELLARDGRALRVQAGVMNLTGRLNVINFAGLFSGTALGVPRSATVRLAAEF